MHVGIPVAPISPASAALEGSRQAQERAVATGARVCRGRAALRASARSRWRDCDADWSCSTSIIAIAPTKRLPRLDRIPWRRSCSRRAPRHAQGRHHAAHALLESTEGRRWPSRRGPPVFCEWLPWNHTFGGNATFNLSLRNGGTFYIDGGKPTPDLIATTARNLRDVSPTLSSTCRAVTTCCCRSSRPTSSCVSLSSRGSTRCSTPGLPCPRISTIACWLWCPRRRAGARACFPGGALRKPHRSQPVCTFQSTVRASSATRRRGRTEARAISRQARSAGEEGPNVTPGYYGGADLTRDAFDDEGFTRSATRCGSSMEKMPRRAWPSTVVSLKISRSSPAPGCMPGPFV